MKKLFLLAAFATTMACSADVESISPTSESLKTITVNVAAPTATRVNIVDNGQGGYNVTWNELDAIGSWGADATTTEQSKFTISNFDSENATFTGNHIDNTTDIFFIHPYDSSITKSQGVITLNTLTQQSITADLSSLSTSTYMRSDLLNIDNATSTSGITISHMGTAIELNLGSDDFDITNYTLSSVVVSGLNATGELDATTMELTTQTADITLSTNDLAAVDNKFTLAFCAFPTSVTSLSVTATLCDLNGAYLTATATVSSHEAIDFARATKNTVYAKLVATTQSDAESSTVEFNAINMTSIAELSEATSWSNSSAANVQKLDTTVSIGDITYTYEDSSTASTNPRFWYYSDIFQIRYYKDGIFSFTCSSGTITKIEFDYPQANYTDDITFDSGEYTPGGDANTTGVWEGSATKVTCSIQGSTYFSRIAVTHQ